MNAANSILESLHDYGWPLFVFILVAPVSVFLFPGRRSAEEDFRRLVLVGSFFAAIVGIFFLLTEGTDIVQIAHLRPLWGLLVIAICVMAIGLTALWLLRTSRLNAIRASLLNADDAIADRPKTGIITIRVLTGCCIVALTISIIWLIRIAQGR